MAGLNTEFIEEGLYSIREIASREGYEEIASIANDLIQHIDEELEE